MTKRKKIIIAVIIALIVIIPVSVFAITKLVTLPNTDEDTILKLNKQDKERALEEKAKYAEEHKNDVAKLNNDVSELSEEELELLEKERQEVKNKEDKIKNVMNRYYPEEFNELLKDIENNTKNQEVVDIRNTPISTEESKLYDIIMRVLEEKNISSEDANVLKDFIEQQRFSIDKDNSLKSRADKILK